MWFLGYLKYVIQWRGEREAPDPAWRAIEGGRRGGEEVGNERAVVTCHRLLIFTDQMKPK